MKRIMKNVLVVLMIVILSVFGLASCGGSNSKDSSDERIQFHDISFECPEGYVRDEELSDDDNHYYKVFDDDENIQKMIYLQYEEIGEPFDLLKPEIAKEYVDGFTSDESVSDYSDYEVVKYNDELSAIEFTYKYNPGTGEYNGIMNIFCDDSGNMYTIMAISLNDDCVDDLNALINSMKYTFDVFVPEAGAEEEQEESDDEPEEEPEEEKSKDKDESEVSPEFKEMMDSYEAFFDEYVEFMKKYQNSNDVAGMMTEYAEYMTKYADYMKKLDDLDEDEMTVAEAAYYTEVNARIMKKLAEIS